MQTSGLWDEGLSPVFRAENMLNLFYAVTFFSKVTFGSSHFLFKWRTQKVFRRFLPADGSDETGSQQEGNWGCWDFRKFSWLLRPLSEKCADLPAS